MSLSHRAGNFVAEHPLLVAVTFAGLLALSVPALVGVQVYLSVYELSPRDEYYDHFVTLNQDLGWDNLGAVLMTLPEDAPSDAMVTDPSAVRAMNALEEELDQLEYVEGTLSLAELVAIMNGRGDFMLEKYGSEYGAFEDGVPELPVIPDEYQPKGKMSGFPEDTEEGDMRIEMSLEIALELLGDQIYGNILAEDHKSALMVVVMETGATGAEYREWQRELLDVGLAFSEESQSPYRGELEYRPLSIDIIYSTLDDVAVTEGPMWILAAVATALATVAVLFRRFSETIIAILVLVVVAAATLSTATWQGVNFNLLSLMVAALIFAAGVDYSMHVINRYREERALGYDPRRALLTTIRTTGPALLTTSITTTAGFMSLYFSLIPAIGSFGVMVGAAIFVAFLTCMSLLPVLLVWADQLRGEVDAHADEATLESRRERLETKVRAEQRGSVLGRLGRFISRRRKGFAAGSVMAFLLVASPMATHGIEVWGGSYLEPHTIFDEDTYPVESLRLMDDTFGIPNELAVLYYGDATDPEVVEYLDRLQDETDDVHGRTKTDSAPNALRLYTTIINPDPTIDQDDNGIPDTQADIRRAYDEMREDPATSILVNRVVVYDNETDSYPIAAHRLGIDPQPAGSVGTDVENYRKSVADVEAVISDLSRDEAAADLDHGTTGLVVLGVEVVDAIIRGNAASVMIMLGVVYLVMLAFWRSPMVAAIGMIPIVAAVLTQYGLTAYLGYEVTYVSLILTGMVMGIGVDDAVHFMNRFREEIRRGKDAEEANALASAEIGSVLVGTTLTTMSPFVVILFSVVTWASQTALLVIPTLFAALAATLLTLPAVLTWHARWRPQAYLAPTAVERFSERTTDAAETILTER